MSSATLANANDIDINDKKDNIDIDDAMLAFTDIINAIVKHDIVKAEQWMNNIDEVGYNVVIL